MVACMVAIPSSADVHFAEFRSTAMVDYGREHQFGQGTSKQPLGKRQSGGCRPAGTIPKDTPPPLVLDLAKRSEQPFGAFLARTTVTRHITAVSDAYGQWLQRPKSCPRPCVELHIRTMFGPPPETRSAGFRIRLAKIGTDQVTE